MSKRKTVWIIVIALVVILAAAIGAYVYRNINEKPPVVVEQQPNSTVNEEETPQSAITLRGEFKDGDNVHSGEGTIEVIETSEGPILSFGSNFSVTQGPDLFVYLSPNAAGQELGEFASLGPLQSISGEQTYTLPANYRDYKTVIIWCRAFSVTFATAELQ